MKNTLINKVTAAAVLVMVSIPAFASEFSADVPEPGGIALMGAGIAVIAVSKYYKSRNK